jgi:hypothetical protein
MGDAGIIGVELATLITREFVIISPTTSQVSVKSVSF